MKIFIDATGRIDFEAPIHMTDRQKNNFVRGIKDIFGNSCDFEEIEEQVKEMGEIERHPKRFSFADLATLATVNSSNEEVAKKLGKTPFAIQMKRGLFLVDLQDWAKKNKRNKITKKDVDKYLKELGVKK